MSEIENEKQLYDGFERFSNVKPFHNFEEKPVAVGRISDAYKINGKYGENDIIVINDEAISLSNVALRGLEKYVGRFVRIEYLGEGINDKTGFKFKKYDVQIKKE